MHFGCVDFPNELVESRKLANLVVFAGAGVSMPAPSNLPSWRRLSRLRRWALRNSSRQTAGLRALTAERLRSAFWTSLLVNGSTLAKRIYLALEVLRSSGRGA